MYVPAIRGGYPVHQVVQHEFQFVPDGVAAKKTLSGDCWVLELGAGAGLGASSSRIKHPVQHPAITTQPQSSRLGTGPATAIPIAWYPLST